MDERITSSPLSRLRALGRSSPIALALLVGANLVPLVGVLFFGWDVGAILITYWLENGIVGVLNVVRILLAQGPGSSGRLAGVGKVGMAAFFTVHYGLFWLVHGMFLMLIAGRLTGSGFDLLTPLKVVLDDPALLVAGLALLVSHTASLVLNYIGRREYLQISAQRQMYVPYSRLFVLHITIVLGGVFIFGLGSPQGLVVLLVLLKTAADVGLHLRERGRYERAALIA